MSTSRKMTKKVKRQTSESTTPPALPNDLQMSSIARVSRLYYPTLSLVSKSLQTLLASAELYQTRSLLGQTDTCVYVCLRFPLDPNPRWFTLCRVPDRTRHTSSGYILTAVTSPSSHSSSNLLAVGSKVYKVGGDVNSPPSSGVSIMDCRYHTWDEAPSMQVNRNSSAAVGLFDGKIYVAGGCDRKSVNWIEVFDPNTQRWSSVTSPRAEIREGNGRLRWIALRGKLYLFGIKGDNGWVYSPNEGKWNPVGPYFNINVAECVGCCVIDDVLFCAYRGLLSWYDYKEHSWEELNIGLKALPDFGEHAYCKMVEYGGKMMLFWGGYNGEKEKMIWCAKIAFERRYTEDTGEIENIWGNVEWLDVVLTVPSSCHMSRMVALSTTV